ncbi:LTA synthase family protein [Lactobacillus sp. PV034]|uniref:LTA synthase family protein n=1 Tax=Lactobacillus sp. PV034 TaxID=2594495 RepID=UPI00223EFEBA|nr:LTA synthase family protein [Lactobacillus sp. PV034]QNQ80985.1 LTA synthase family protein [Lactobacillus sp. PV034]
MSKRITKYFTWLLSLGLIFAIWVSLFFNRPYHPNNIGLYQTGKYGQLFLIVFGFMLLGAINLPAKFKQAGKVWLTGYIGLFILQVIICAINYSQFKMWQVFGMLLPLIAGVSPIFTGIVIFFLLKKYFDYFLDHFSKRQSGIILVFVSLVIWAVSGSGIGLASNLFGLLLIIAGVWGMWLKRQEYKINWAIFSFVAFIFLSIFIVWSNQTLLLQFPDVQKSMPAGMTFLDYPPSAVMLLSSGLLLYSLKFFVPFVNQYLFNNIYLALIITESPIFVTYFNYLPSGKKARLLAILICLVLIAIYSIAINYGLKKLVFMQKIVNIFDQKSLGQIIIVAWDKVIAYIKQHKLFFWTCLYLLILAWLSIFIVSKQGRINGLNSQNIFWYILAQRMFVPILTALFLLALFGIFVFITTRYWVSLSLVTVFIIGLAIADQIKISLRGEPIYPTELREALNANTLLGMINPGIIVAAVIGLLIIVAITIFLEIKFPQHVGTIKSRLIGLVLGFLLWCTPSQFNNLNSPIYYLSRAFDNSPIYSAPTVDAEINGPLLMLFDYSNVATMDKPAGYSQAAITRLEQKYRQKAKVINQDRTNKLGDQTMIFNLSESFTDPLDFPTVKLKSGVADPMKFIRHLSQQTTSGKMLSGGYGGGTAKMEYESLTGFNIGTLKGQIMPYQQIVPSYPFYPSLGMNYAYSSAIHPFFGTYYSRQSVYKTLGFDKFVFIGSKYKIHHQKKLGESWYLSDETLYRNAEDQLSSHKGSQFINLISMQNHLPYNNWYSNNEYLNKIKVDLPQTKGIDSQSLATYTKGVQYTDQAVEDFIKQIDKLNRPIIFVFYGDHYPAIIDQSKLNNYPIQLHATNYFIYANKYAREHGAKNKVGDSNYVSTADFIPMALEQGNIKVSPFQALLTQVQKELPAITVNYKAGTGIEFVDQNGKEVSEKSLTKKQRQLLHDYELIQYDMSQGEGYTLKANKSFYKSAN